MAEDTGHFDFLGLPAEMRNVIYEEALTHNRNEGRLANISLLRVCKQIHAEAKALFHARSAFTITAECHLHGSTTGTGIIDGDPLPITVYGDVVVPRTDISSHSTFANTFPQAVAEASNINLTIILPSKFYILRSFQTLFNFMYCLASQLTSDSLTACKNVSVTVECDRIYLREFQLKAMLWPFAKVSEVTALQFNNGEVERYVQRLRSNQHIQEIRCNAISAWKQVQTLVQRQLGDPVELELVGWMQDRLAKDAKYTESCLETASGLIRPIEELRICRNIALLSRWVELRKSGLSQGLPKALFHLMEMWEWTNDFGVP